MFRIFRSALMFAALLFMCIGIAKSQSPTMSQIGEDRPVSAVERQAIVDSVGALMNRMYVFPDKAAAASKLLQQNLKKGMYDSLNSIAAFSQQLTADLRASTHDGHLWVEPADQPPVGKDEMLTYEEGRARRFEYGKQNNFGFAKLEILPGNIGYLDLHGFFAADIGGPTAIAAMNYLANCRALIIDLRQNGGGDPSMIQLITSYFFDEPVHLNSFYSRLGDSISQFWTQTYVEGPRLSHTPLYVLTSGESFSAAEEFAYNLKNLGRARLVGQTTGGGAHPNELIHFPNLRINVSVAWGRAINPITGTNWEGVGVAPDVVVSTEYALAAARMIILDSLINIEPDSLNRRQLSWWRSALQYDTLQFAVSAEKLGEYAGQYGPRRIWLENGTLWYQRDNNPKAKLIPLEADLFQHAASQYFRVKFVRDNTGKVTELIGLYAQGHQDSNRKDG